MTHATYNPWGAVLIDVDPRANCKKSETNIAGVLLRRRQVRWQ